ncbi:ABC transporter ATP-binding protein [Pseudoleptotrichia goodfellowii]|uniref:ABC transporter, ATP-binding protein n=1 Tax=Pseudoleptotrichia goodfellowii F0264 TaxID=596323 RepID=D0GLG2_9FUSO|nr:ABC transporter ATP-binding protein [Pseudoleptotrichia goodfellowii]EEY35040.1 ABC transporter, ATP-binding protein [Pseudoleptotrichia goodfellowii F0264]
MERLIINSLKTEIDKTEILKGISFKLNKGETLIIIGESGSEKTMLSRLLIGMKPENAIIRGNIYFDDKDLLSMIEKERSNYRGKRIAYIAQNPMAVFNDFQSIESHTVELFQSQLNFSKKECQEKMISGMKELNLPNSEEIMKKYPFQLSGGMFQRVMFAMMMQLQPELLIADEPTSALDYYNSEKVAEMLKKFQSKNTALIVITHDYDLAEKLGGKVMIMRNGEIVEEGITSEMLKNPESNYGKELLLRKTHTRYKKRSDNV